MRFAFIALVLALAGVAFASMSSEDLAAAKKLIDSETSCDELSDGQLELIGEYYMEQMHPGEQHELMDRMMGGEGSERLKLQHIQIAQVLYCGRSDTNVTYGGMMAMMPMFYRSGGYYTPGAFGSGMMGSGMMGGFYGGGMMDGLGWVLGLVFWILVLVTLILLVIWLYKNVTGTGTLSAKEVLKQRYAKGEITKKQYEEMKKDLQES